MPALPEYYCNCPIRCPYMYGGWLRYRWPPGCLVGGWPPPAHPCPLVAPRPGLRFAPASASRGRMMDYLFIARIHKS